MFEGWLVRGERTFGFNACGHVIVLHDRPGGVETGQSLQSRTSKKSLDVAPFLHSLAAIECGGLIEAALPWVVSWVAVIVRGRFGGGSGVGALAEVPPIF